MNFKEFWSLHVSDLLSVPNLCKATGPSENLRKATALRTEDSPCREYLV